MNENRSKAVCRELILLGAQIEDNFTDQVTHVIFKDGKKKTFERATKLGLYVVSVLWVERYVICNLI